VANIYTYRIWREGCWNQKK